MIHLLIAIAAGLFLVWIFRNRMGSARLSFKSGMFSAWSTAPHEEKKQIKNESEEKSKKEKVDLDFSEINRAYRIADMHFSRGDFREAEKWFIKVLALHENHPETLNRLGVIYIQQGNPRRAEILYRKLFSITQKEPAYYCNYGRCLYNQGRLSEAVEAYENAVKLDSGRATRFVSIGQIYYEQKEYIKAIAYFVRALELEPQNLEYLSVTAELAEMVGDTERLHKSLKKIVELDPYNEKVREKLASFTP